MTKKIFKIICINLLVFVALIAITESILFNAVKNEFKEEFKTRQEMDKRNGVKFVRHLEYSLKTSSFDYSYEKSQMRKPEGQNYKKKPIILFGCSFAFGDGLDTKDTFSYKLSHLSKRPVYNRAYQGWSIQQILYQLRRDDFYKEVKAPEYIIYTLMDEHVNRLFKYQFAPPNNHIVLRYKLTKNGFEEIHPFLKPLWSLYSVNNIQSFVEHKILYADSNKQKNLQYYYLMLKECKRLATQHYPNAKFVILVYRDKPYMFIDDPDLRKKLKDDGFIIVDTDELTPKGLLISNEYKTIDKCHPSGKAWDVIAPALIKKLNL